jgi:hypothetical protein
MTAIDARTGACQAMRRIGDDAAADVAEADREERRVAAPPPENWATFGDGQRGILVGRVQQASGGTPRGSTPRALGVSAFLGFGTRRQQAVTREPNFDSEKLSEAHTTSLFTPARAQLTPFHDSHQPTMHTVPNWHLQCYTYNRHSGGQCLDRAGTGVLSAFQCPALVWHWSVQCPPVSCFPMALQCPSAPVPHRNGHPKSKFRVGEGRQCQEMRLLRRN